MATPVVVRRQSAPTAGSPTLALPSATAAAAKTATAPSTTVTRPERPVSGEETAATKLQANIEERSPSLSTGSRSSAGTRKEGALPASPQLSGPDIDTFLSLSDSPDDTLRSPPLRSTAEECLLVPAGSNKPPPTEPLTVIILRDCILYPFLQGFFGSILGHLGTFLTVRNPLRPLIYGFANLAKWPFKKRESDFVD